MKSLYIVAYGERLRPALRDYGALKFDNHAEALAKAGGGEGLLRSVSQSYADRGLILRSFSEAEWRWVEDSNLRDS